MGTRGLLFCFVLCLVLFRIYSINVLENMKDLKEKTDFGKQYPRQGLELLCWLLSQGKIDQNGKLRLNFNPAENVFSFHMYKNYEHSLPDLSNTDFQYFSLGNLIKGKDLPHYITKVFCNEKNHPKSNIDRVLITIRKKVPTVVDEVFITQHHEDRKQGSAYVKDLTYKIGKELLKEIAELCQDDEDSRDRNPDQNDPDYERFLKIQQLFPNTPHLHLFLYQAGYNPDNNVKKHGTSKSPDKSDKLKLELRSSPNGQVRIVWDWIPKEMMEREMKISIYKGKDEDKPLVEYPLNGRLCGEIDTHLITNPDLELRLQPITNFETFENNERESDYTVPKAVEVSFFTFSSLFSLVLYPFSSLFSLVLYPFSSLFSLVLYLFSSLFSLVLYLFSSLFSLVLYPFSSLFSLVLYLLSSLFSLVLYLFSSLYSLVLYTFSSLFSLVVVIELVRRLIPGLTEPRPRAEPPFVSVSHGRPGF
ncbi:hypothetical protein Q7C36_001597 [Tachysurus vachellii]|uniref:Uncharacterized protein n=1 Tax=Tachysurus vachellii TaxID=175792 RepID=A0AA88NT58_TACVA|nr:hypothetical protein Q7C36_001597 [Tachysurus vachellii]